jgi:hypothetical protein
LSVVGWFAGYLVSWFGAVGIAGPLRGDIGLLIQVPAK